MKNTQHKKRERDRYIEALLPFGRAKPSPHVKIRRIHGPCLWRRGGPRSRHFGTYPLPFFFFFPLCVDPRQSCLINSLPTFPSSLFEQLEMCVWFTSFLTARPQSQGFGLFFSSSSSFWLKPIDGPIIYKSSASALLAFFFSLSRVMWRNIFRRCAFSLRGCRLIFRVLRGPPFVMENNQVVWKSAAIQPRAPHFFSAA